MLLWSARVEAVPIGGHRLTRRYNYNPLRFEEVSVTAHPFHEFFAGSGLVSIGLSPYFETVWANDVSETKAQVYRENLDGEHLHVGDIAEVDGSGLPPASLSWASFPCQDLSLAGKIGGIRAERSGLVWQWLRIIDELGESAPRVICLENVSGLVSSRGGEDYVQLHEALRERGYRVGAILVNADHFVPQSRPRVFVIGTKGGVPEGLSSTGPTWLHPTAVRRVAAKTDDFIWWAAEEPAPLTTTLADIVEEVPFDRDDIVRYIPEKHVGKFSRSGLMYASAYMRTRNHRQQLELRCDGIAGCLRTPAGGSSRQYVVMRDGRGLHARLMTVRETARLMGAPDSYILPERYNDGYMAMGDAVVAPVAHWLAENFLSELVEAAYGTDE